MQQYNICRYELYHDGEKLVVIDLDSGNIGVPTFSGLYAEIFFPEDLDRFEINEEGTEMFDLDTGKIYQMEIKW